MTGANTPARRVQVLPLKLAKKNSKRSQLYG